MYEDWKGNISFYFVKMASVKDLVRFSLVYLVFVLGSSVDAVRRMLL